jgi:hypothetical protein
LNYVREFQENYRKPPGNFSLGRAEPPAQPAPIPEPAPPADAGPRPEAPGPPPAVHPPCAAPPEPRPVQSQETADELYSNLLKFCCDLAAAGITGAPIRSESLISWAKDLVAGTRASPDRLLFHALDEEVRGLFQHTANVTVLSLYLANEMKLPDHDLELLCHVSLIHDLAMYDIAATHLSDLADFPQKKSIKELSDLERRLPASLKVVHRIFAPDQALAEQVSLWVRMVHDKAGASKGKPAPLPCWIVRLCEIYEAMTHRRPWREALLPHAAMSRILQLKGHLFSPRLVKFALTRLTMFPPGSYAELSSGETAQVVSLNRGYLCRPVVAVLDLKAHPPSVLRRVDLLENPTLHIRRQIPKPQATAR